MAGRWAIAEIICGVVRYTTPFDRYDRCPVCAARMVPVWGVADTVVCVRAGCGYFAVDGRVSRTFGAEREK